MSDINPKKMPSVNLESKKKNELKLRNQYDWAGVFQTMAFKIASAISEEQMYSQLREFKDEFNSEYGKLSRAKRLVNEFREKNS